MNVLMDAGLMCALFLLLMAVLVSLLSDNHKGL